ncbi:hypothetical protein [Roseicyclus persicicus]|uniref:DUF4115 domain-containing protein n=1 Tax=Roseicyclus persicicus TaxID=2650661 RepID=A0A7X6JX70_9RHOB|nr:hypothetical protein [Roseibacterium persicicum]NKX45222.1 hypothetical protein [Roseibacterium persicicum]
MAIGLLSLLVVGLGLTLLLDGLAGDDDAPAPDPAPAAIPPGAEAPDMIAAAMETAPAGGADPSGDAAIAFGPDDDGADPEPEPEPAGTPDSAVTVYSAMGGADDPAVVTGFDTGTDTLTLEIPGGDETDADAPPHAVTTRLGPEGVEVLIDGDVYVRLPGLHSTEGLVIGLRTAA